jgi:hypothetical protein
VTLEHELRSAGARIPELYTTILRAGKHPVSIRSKSHRQDKVPVTLESLDTLAALRAGLVSLARSAEFPHLDRPVKTARDEILAARRESNRVDAIFVAVRSLETLNKETRVEIPNTHTLVERASGDKLGIGRNGNGRHTIFDSESKSIRALLDIPQADGPIATTRCNSAPIACKV